MQHIVQIAFDFDDDSVKKKVEDGCVDSIYKELKQDVIDGLYEKRWGDKHANVNNGLQSWVIQEVYEILTENKEHICELAAHEIVQSMNKSTKWKDKIIENLKEG